MLEARFPEETYAAGLWRSDLVRGLQWYRPEGTELINSYNDFISGPLWSWASVIGPITFVHSMNSKPSQHSQILIDVQDVHCEGMGLDQHGAVTGGSLRIKAPVLSLQVAVIDSLDGGRPSYEFRRQGRTPCIVHLDHKTPKEFMFYPDDIHNPIQRSDLNARERLDERNGSAKVRTVVGPVWIQFLEIERDLRQDKNATYRCLILENRGRSDDRLKRCGYWAFSSSDPEWLDSAEYRTVEIL